MSSNGPGSPYPPVTSGYVDCLTREQAAALQELYKSLPAVAQSSGLTPGEVSKDCWDPKSHSAHRA
jgi:hypothetical protein